MGGVKIFWTYTVQFINIISYLSEKYLLKVGLMANNKIDTGVDKIGLAEGEVDLIEFNWIEVDLIKS